MRIVVIAFVMGLIVNTVFAQVQLPVIFGDGMVLQQQSEVKIWGKSTSKESITIFTSWNTKTYKTKTNANGKWMLEVETPVAGGPYDIKIVDGKEVVLKDVMIGEVWICSGQSNMAMPMKGYRNQPVYGSLNDIVNSTNPNIRLFTVKKNTSEVPLEDFEGNWKSANPQNVADFSATAYYFGNLLNKVLGVPVGLICTSWGGTRIEPWISENTIKTFDFINEKRMNTKRINQRPSYLFNAMVNPIKNFGARGTIWYQGESNKDGANEYKALLTGLIKDWREEWDDEDFSFYYAQIAPYDYSEGKSSALIRQEMLEVSQMDIPKVGMASLMDVGEKASIHPGNKKPVGERLAYLALSKTYDIEGIPFSGPVLKEMKQEGKFLKLFFDHAKFGLTSFGKPLEHFELAGKDMRFHKAKANITDEGILLFSDSVEKPVAVRYAFDDWVEGELFNTEGLPASSFEASSLEQE